MGRLAVALHSIGGPAGTAAGRKIPIDGAGRGGIDLSLRLCSNPSQIDCPVPPPQQPPYSPAIARQRQFIQGLSERAAQPLASSAAAERCEQRRAAAAGGRRMGCAFLCLLSFAQAKESRSPSGETVEDFQPTLKYQRHWIPACAGVTVLRRTDIERWCSKDALTVWSTDQTGHR